MNPSQQIQGWKIHHQEQLIYQSNSGNPLLKLKFFHYPHYRQEVVIEKFPERCVLKTKKNNSFFVFHHKVRTKGIISLERIINVRPTPSAISLQEDWGKITDFPKTLQRKYQQSFRYWPISTTLIDRVATEDWFTHDDLSNWVSSAYRYIRQTIRFPENQEKRLGAEQAMITGVGDCDEFTDLFVTLARYRGIPSRRLTGYVIKTKNDVEPHAWGEVLSPKLGWIPVDAALNKIGVHGIPYVIVKIEEFNPSLSDYDVQSSKASKMHFHWVRPLPIVTPI
jgi:hypothetical protein